mmetsp:Transcript_27076/g.37315  ORF Transcript_27076/g.37315 Transcript_27076/m.37315 type:complete len:80 (-) Transcript_27076:1019-1258(-)
MKSVTENFTLTVPLIKAVYRLTKRAVESLHFYVICISKMSFFVPAKGSTMILNQWYSVMNAVIGFIHLVKELNREMRKS